LLCCERRWQDGFQGNQVWGELKWVLSIASWQIWATGQSQTTEKNTASLRQMVSMSTGMDPADGSIPKMMPRRSYGKSFQKESILFLGSKWKTVLSGRTVGATGVSI
jgi:hypothetical protein